MVMMIKTEQEKMNGYEEIGSADITAGLDFARDQILRVLPDFTENRLKTRTGRTVFGQVRSGLHMSILKELIPNIRLISTGYIMQARFRCRAFLNE